MAFAVLMNVRHNLSRTLKLCNKLSDVKTLDVQVRHLPRWGHRQPIKIFNVDDSSTDNNKYVEKLKIERESIQHVTPQRTGEIGDPEYILGETNIHKSEQEPHVESCQSLSHEGEGNVSIKTPEDKHKDKRTKTKKEDKEEKKKDMKMNKLKESAARAGVPLFTKLPDSDPKLSQLMTIAKSKNKKVTRSHIVLEGKRLIRDAIDAGYVPEQVFFSRVSDVADLKLPDGIKLYKVPYKQIELWSSVTTPPGIVGFLKTADIEKKMPSKDALPLIILCDNIRDPGNLGTILRGAAGVGCHKIILLKGCVDLWEPKVLRSGAGAHFRVPVVRNVSWDDLRSHVDDDASVFLADSNALSSHDDTPVSPGSYEQLLNSIPVIPYFAAEYPKSGTIVLVIGGETEGLSNDSFKLALERSGVRLNIPLSNDVDSLNSGIAFGIIVFEMKRQFLRKVSHKHKNNAEEIEIQAQL